MQSRTAWILQMRWRHFFFRFLRAFGLALQILLLQKLRLLVVVLNDTAERLIVPRDALGLMAAIVLNASSQAVNHGLSLGRKRVLHARGGRRVAGPGEQGTPRLHHRLGAYTVAVCRQLTERSGHMPERIELNEAKIRTRHKTLPKLRKRFSVAKIRSRSKTLEEFFCF